MAWASPDSILHLGKPVGILGAQTDWPISRLRIAFIRAGLKGAVYRHHFTRRLHLRRDAPIGRA